MVNMCDLYGCTKGHAAIIALVRAMRDKTSNLPLCWRSTLWRLLEQRVSWCRICGIAGRRLSCRCKRRARRGF
jgi:hypothetical protein